LKCSVLYETPFGDHISDIELFTKDNTKFDFTYWKHSFDKNSGYGFCEPSISLDDISSYLYGNICLDEKILVKLIRKSWMNVKLFITKFMLLNSVTDSNDIVLLLKLNLSSVYSETHYLIT